MVSKRKREEGRERYQDGKDAEDWEYYKAKINPMNRVERHERPNSPYDFKVKRRDPAKAVKKFWNKP